MLPRPACLPTCIIHNNNQKCLKAPRRNIPNDNLSNIYETVISLKKRTIKCSLPPLWVSAQVHRYYESTFSVSFSSFSNIKFCTAQHAKRMWNATVSVDGSRKTGDEFIRRSFALLTLDCTITTYSKPGNPWKQPYFKSSGEFHVYYRLCAILKSMEHNR